ncbi:ATP-binding protein [uncultured Aquabacterium sp.]|uniref:ATP-binding protein n=1 Tax=uncultured Aquabacterium sp. TaxID=158753 RepID=UPI0025D129DF|nr:ATP-binding protein [uncultured Aquabacterium sp.]
MEPLSKAIEAGKQTRQVECEQHGMFTSVNIFRTVWSRCPTCEDLRHKAEQEAVERGRVLAERERLQQKLGRAAIPKRFIGRGFDNFTVHNEGQAKALEIAQAYAEGFDAHMKTGRGLVLSGKPGTGKSHLAAAILQSVLARHAVLYVTCMDVIRMVRETWRKDSPESERDVLQRLGRMSLLVIDEVGVQYGTEGEQTILFDVLDLRYREVLPTILMTNQDLTGMKQFLGERTWDRIRETCRWVPFEWESYRPQARKEAIEGKQA